MAHRATARPVLSSASRRGAGDAPFQSVEACRSAPTSWCVTPSTASQIAALASKLPDNIEGELVGPAVQGVIFKVLARYTVREIFSSKRAEIQQTIESEAETESR